MLMPKFKIDKSPMDSIESAIIYLLDSKSVIPEVNHRWFSPATKSSDWGDSKSECPEYGVVDPGSVYKKYTKTESPKCPLVILDSLHNRENDYRLFSATHCQLLTPAHELIGDRAEIAMFNLDMNDGEDFVKWYLLKRLPGRPKGLITNAPSDRIFYAIHYRYLSFQGKQDSYLLHISAYSPSTQKFYAVAEKQSDFKYLATNSLENAAHFPLLASIIEDSRCPYFFHVTITDAIGIKLYVWPNEVQELFRIRDNPLTDTGRKRPIIHWVCEHLRRKPVNPGYSEIPEHLRGITEFELDGLHIRIEPAVTSYKSFYKQAIMNVSK